MQLWVAQPAATRNAPPAFEHHPELPKIELDCAVGTVLIGQFAGVASPARRDTDHVGVDLGAGTTTVPVRADFEHGLVVFTGAVGLDDRTITPRHLAYLRTGPDEITLTTAERSRALLFGGVPFDEPVLMWWNYVGRTRDEITRAHTDWMTAADRFGHVGSTLPRIEVGPPPWTR